MLLAAAAMPGLGAEPQVRTVPWVAADPAIPHDTYAYRKITLKGTSNLAGPNIRATWDFGDGTEPVSFAVRNQYDVSAPHIYYGHPGTTYTARLTVTDTTTGESGSATYLVAMRERTLNTEVNVAIDEGLWALHAGMTRSRVGEVDLGSWNADTTAWNVLAFERHGHRESGDSNDPYTETVARGIRTLLQQLGTRTDKTLLDAIRAAESPNTVAVTGPEGVAGQTYRRILADRALATTAATDAAVNEPQLTDIAGLPTQTLYQISRVLTPVLYAADTNKGDVADGVARTLLRRQSASGTWPQAPTDSAHALMLLDKTPARAAGVNSVLNVTAQVNITTTGFLFSRTTNTFNGTMTVTNTSGSPIPGPITVGLHNITPGVTLANGNGTFNGAPYVSVGGTTPLNAGASATAQLRFNNPGNAVINFTRVAYSGTFPPAALTLTCPASSIIVNTPYSSSMSADGGVQLYTYSVGPGSLPNGLTLNPATGAITGNPDTIGPVNFTAKVTDSAGGTPQQTTQSCTISVNPATSPDLVISKTHTGNFTQGSTGNTYTVTVTNTGTADKTAGQLVTVTDAPPSGLTVTAMSGTGWTCTTLPTCTRTDALTMSSAYPPITVTVSVAANATSPQVNSITVTSAQAESSTGNNTATDSTIIVQPDLTITKTHTGNFTQGSTGNTYTVTVTNSGTGDKLAGQSVSVTDAPPAGLTVTAMSGTGWTCTTLPTCTRTDAVAPAASYPPITVTVSVTASATSPQVNVISVTTAQNESNSGNNSASDSTTIVQPDLTITKTHTGDFEQGSTTNTYTVTVTNSGTGEKLAGQSVSVTDTAPTGITVTAMSGTGWTCTTLPTCTRTDALAAAASYPAITVTVSVAADATSPKVNSVSVSTAQNESNTGNNTANDSTVITVSSQPDLTITKTHTGNFTQGSTGNTYTVTVTNSGSGAKTAGQSVSVTDAPPSGLTVTAMTGTGWTCTTLPTCTRNDVLAASSSYPPITVTVSVTSNATSPQVNSISVTTAQTESNNGNNTATDSTTIVQPDLTITKTHTGNFTQGSTGNTYTVTVTNSGTGEKLAGQSISVTDTPPAGLTVTAMSGTGWTCTTLPTCTRNDVLAASASYPTITVTVSVASNATSPQVNAITVSTAQNESNTGNNNANDSTTIVQPDLTITKSHSGDFAQGSTGNTYTVTVTNSGTGDKLAGQSVSVTDSAPTGLTVTAMAGTGWTCTTLPTCTRNDALAPAASYPSITVTVSVAADATSPKVNSATVTTAQSESNTGNNTANDSTVITVVSQPDLTISKSHTGNFTQGSTGNTYTVVVSNSGAGEKTAGQSVSVTDTPPVGLTVTAMSGTGWTCTTLPTCTRNDALAAAGSYPPITVTVTVAANATSPQVNSISVTTAQTESNGANNTATDSTVIVQPDLTITKTHTGSFVQGSAGNTYTVTVTNSGSGTKNAGQSVSVTDVPPSGLTVTAMTGTGWTCTTLPTCTRNDALAPAASYPSITVTVTVAGNATSPQVNSITVSTAQSESNTGNNTANDSTVITQPDLTISKSHTGSFTQGSTGNTYTVTVTNSGVAEKSAGQSVSVTDAPPSGLTVTAMTGTGWTCTTLPTCTRNDVLPASSSYPPITVTVTVSNSASSPQINSVTVTTAQGESNTGNNTATDSTVIVQPDLTITKSHTGNFLQGSTGNTYTVVVTNSGAGTKNAGQSVSVTDAPPTGLTVTAMAGTGWTCTTLPTCTRTDALAPAASYDPITVTVSVASNATTPKVNSISVTTAQSESNSGNNTATDSTIIDAPPQITSANTVTFAPGKTGQSFTVTTTGQPTGASMVISQTGTLPTGVVFTNNNNGTATINGTPAAGTQGSSGNPKSQAYSLTIGADNGVPPPASQAFTLNITCPVITVSGAAAITGRFNAAITGSTYGQTGGNGAITWSATGLPTNLSIGSGTGTISGTPNVTGTFNVTVTAEDAGGCQGSLAISVAIGPNLANHTVSGVGNTQIFVTGVSGAPSTPAIQNAATLLTGATPGDTQVTVVSTGCTAGGTLSNVDTAGRFIFTPNVGATSATCTYTATSNTGTAQGSTGPAPTTANLTFNLSGEVWYVNSSETTNGDGRSHSPFNNMTSASTSSSTNDYVFVHTGTGTTTGAITLEAGQTLWGQGTTFTLGGLTILSGTKPTLGGTVTIGGNNVTISSLNIASTTSTGLTNTGSVTGATVQNDVVVTTTSGTAVSLSNLEGTLTFRSISSNSATNGISLTNTTGSFTVTGNTGGLCGGQVSGVPASVTAPVTSDCTGGTIQSSTGAGIVLNSAQNVSLTRIRVMNSGSDGLQGTNVTNFTLASSFFDSNGNAVNENGVEFGDTASTTPDGLHGTCTVTNSTIRHSYYNGFSVRNFNGAALTSCNITGSQFFANPANGDANDNVFFEASGTTGSIVTSISGSYFSSTEGDHFQAAGANSGSVNVTFTNNTLTGGHSTGLGQGITINAATGVAFGGYTGTMTYDINGNSINGAVSNAIITNLGTSGAGGTMTGRIRNNLIGTSSSALSCSTQANGIAIDAHGNGTHTVSITGNTIKRCFDRGISVLANDGSGVLNMTITGNVINDMTDTNAGAGTPREAFFMNAGSADPNIFGVPDAHAVCLTLTSSSGNMVGGAFKTGDIRVRQRFRNSVRLPGYAGTAFDTTAVVTFLQGNNTGATATATANNDGGVTTDGFFGGASCPVP